MSPPTSSPDGWYTTADGRRATLRRATPADLQAVTALLRSAGLPLEGVAPWLGHFWLVLDSTSVVGAAGMERYGESALLRSVVVAPEWRNSGVARTLVERVLEEGRAAGVREVYLLTTTAERYFPRLGFGRVKRESVPSALQPSAEFTGACPSSAVVMRKTVAG